MKARSLIFAAVAACLAVTQAAKAQDMALADSLYVQRAPNAVDKIVAARTEYLKVLTAPGTSNAQKIAAASQMGRLWIYQGEMLTPESDRTTREALFRDC